MKKIYPFICFVFINLFGYAQLHIAKDNINCLYGLKNEKNSWVIQPKYNYIKEMPYSDGFDVFDGLHHGVLTEDGKLIIPLTHDFVSRNINYYLGYNNEKIRVYNKSGKALTEQVYDIVEEYDYSHDYVWCYKTYPDSVLTSLLNIHTGFLFHDVNGYVREWMDSTYTIFQQNRNLSHQMLGVLDSTGKTIIPKLYDEISIRKNYFIATKGNTVLFLNQKNQVIQGPFSRITNLDNTIIVTKNDSSYSLITNDLETVIPFGKYDRINYLGHKKSLKVSYHKKYGTIDSIGNTIVPFLYDDLIAIGGYDSTLKFICKIDDKYGVLNQNGSVELNAEYNLYKLQTGYSSDLHFLIKDKEVYYLDMSPKLEKLQYLFTNNYGAFYKNENYTMFLKLPSGSGKGIIVAGQVSPNFGLVYLGNLFSIYNKSAENEFEVFDLKGNKIFSNQLRFFYRTEFYLPNVNPANNRFQRTYGAILAVTKNNRHGLFSYRTGEPLIDTLYSSIVSSYPFYNSEKINLICKTYLSGQYDIFDTLGVKIKSIQCDTFYQVKKFNCLKAGYNGKMGIMNNNYDWRIKPQYKYIDPLTENLFLIVNQNNKVAIIDANSRLITDTLYTDFTPVFNNFYQGFVVLPDSINGFTSDKREQWWLLKNRNERELISSKGKRIKSYLVTDSNAKIIDSMLLKFAINGEYVNCGDGFCDYSFVRPDGSHNIADGAFKIIMTKEDKTQLLKKSYVNELFGILNKANSDQVKILKNYNQPPLDFTTDRQKILKTFLNKQVYNFGKSFVSLQTGLLTLNYDSTNYTGEYYRSNYENYILVDNKLNKISFSEVFKNDEFFTTEVIRAIKKEEDLKMDCSNMNDLYQKINGRFNLSKDGIYIMIEDEHNNEYPLLITKERLMANAEIKWLIPYLR